MAAARAVGDAKREERLHRVLGAVQRVLREAGEDGIRRYNAQEFKTDRDAEIWCGDLFTFASHFLSSERASDLRSLPSGHTNPSQRVHAVYTPLRSGWCDALLVGDLSGAEDVPASWNGWLALRARERH